MINKSTKGPQRVVSSSTALPAAFDDKPLYDATNYTFPDTTTVDGIAEVLEVSFVHSCM